MKASRISPTEWASGAAGAVLLLALFLPWYGGESGFSVLPAVAAAILAAIAVAAVLLPPVCATQPKSDLPIVYETWLTILAALGLILVIVRAVAPPEGGVGAGAVLALIGTAGLACCAWRAMVRGN